MHFLDKCTFYNNYINCAKSMAFSDFQNICIVHSKFMFLILFLEFFSINKMHEHPFALVMFYSYLNCHAIIVVVCNSNTICTLSTITSIVSLIIHVFVHCYSLYIKLFFLFCILIKKLFFYYI